MRIKKNYASYAQGLTSLASPSLNIDLKKEIVGVESSNFFFPLSLLLERYVVFFSRPFPPPSSFKDSRRLIDGLLSF